MQFSLRRLFLCVTVAAILAALARVALASVLLALASGALSFAAVVLPSRLFRSSDAHYHSIFVLIVMGLVAGGSLLLGTFLGMLCAWASVMTILEAFGR
jgi:hypothetical protein